MLDCHHSVNMTNSSAIVSLDRLVQCTNQPTDGQYIWCCILLDYIGATFFPAFGLPCLFIVPAYLDLGCCWRPKLEAHIMQQSTPSSFSKNADRLVMIHISVKNSLADVLHTVHHARTYKTLYRCTLAIFTNFTIMNLVIWVETKRQISIRHYCPF